MKRNSKDTALKRDDFHRELAAFLLTGESTVGDARFGQTAWVWVRHLGNRYYLNSDSTAAGVSAYLSLVDRYGPKLLWSTVENANGRPNKAAFGPDQITVEGFYLYRQI